MKKNCFGKWHFWFAIIFVFLASTSGRAQGYNSTTWKFSNPKQFGFTITDEDFFDDNNVLAVGSDGGIAKSTDGGRNWTYGVFTYLNATGALAKQSFNDVHFITATVAYAVGNGGLMVKTTDGGLTWSFVTSPLFGSSKNINAVWFIDANKGYIGGQWNAADSIPKLYVTNNGGATWDSMSAPIGGKTRVGYVNNVNLPAQIWDVTAKGKEIYRIEFTSPTQGYIIGGGQSHFPPIAAANASTCLPTGGFTSTSANNAALIWRYNNGTLYDYSMSKEKLGFSGIVTNTITCTTQYNAAQITPTPQAYRAMNIINDSMIVIMSFNNNIVVRIYTGKNDSTLNMITGLKEPGRYQITNFPFPPTQGPEAGTPIPANQVLLASNPYQIRRAANGKLFAGAGNGALWTSVDTGRNWVRETSLPQGQNYSNFATPAFDISPGGKFLSMGTNGVVADSAAGIPWRSNYIAIPASASYNKIEFADCSNGIAAGGSSITVTTDGGATWIDKVRADFAANFYNINGLVYPTASKAYFAVTNGTIYSSPDQGTTLDPIFADLTVAMNDVAVAGDTIFAMGFTTSVIPAASRTSKFYRSVNGGTTWTTYAGFPVGTLAQNFSDIEFPTNLIGYAAGNRDTLYKTTDGGVTWNKLPLPFPGVTPQLTYTDMFALDANTVFLTGNGFPRRIIIKTTDGGATWTDITNNASTISTGNMNGVLFSDANNGYVVCPGGVLLKTNNGGASWTIDVGPTASLFQTMAFAPKKAPASVPFANRKLFICGGNVSGAPMMEYGNPANVNVNTNEVVTNATCTNLTAGSITVTATGAIAPYTYSVDGGSFQTSSVFNGLTQGPHTITVLDSYCGKLIKTVNVGFTDNLALTTNNDTIVCSGAPVQMSASTNGTGATYAWSPAGGLSATNIGNPIATVISNSAYTVTASLNGCIRNKTVNIGIKPNPVINAGPDKTIVEGDEVTLFGTGILNPVSVAWTPTASILNGVNSYTAVVKPNVTTTYTLTVKNSDNCTSTDNTVVTVQPYCIKVMNAFTPNGDGINDKWLVTNGGCTTQIKVAVYNRYGSVIYKNDNYTNDWDGTYNGKPVADGTYYFSATYQTISGRTVTVTGDVTILR